MVRTTFKELAADSDSKRSKPPRRLIVVDCAWNPIATGERRKGAVRRLLRWHASFFLSTDAIGYPKETTEGPDSTSFWRWVASKGCSSMQTWIIGYGIGDQLSLLGFWSDIESGAVNLGSFLPRGERPDKRSLASSWRGWVVTGDPPTIIVCRRRGMAGSLRILDVRNYVNASISDIMAESSVTVEEGDKPLLNKWMKCDESIARLEAVSRWVRTWFNTIALHDLGEPQSTVSAQAMTAYRHRFEVVPIERHRIEDISDSEREAYYGGMVLSPYRGKVERPLKQAIQQVRKDFPQEGSRRWGRIVELDVNALYPYVMASYPMPMSLIGTVKSPSMSQLEESIANEIVIAGVDVSGVKRLYPWRENGQTRLGHGSFTTVLAHAELEEALSLDEIDSVHWMIRYRRGADFSKWLHEMASLRKAMEASGMASHAKAIKRLMNGLAGKFAQRESQWEQVNNHPAPRPWCSWWEAAPGSSELRYFRSIAWHVQEFKRGGEGRYAFTAIAACVTSAARVYMQRLMDIAGWDQVFYVDTDSLHVTERGLAELDIKVGIHPATPGLLKYVGEHESIVYYGPKHYESSLKVVHAGVPDYADRVSDRLFNWTSGERLDRRLISGHPDDLHEVKRKLLIPSVSEGNESRAWGWVGYPRRERTVV